MKRQEMIWSIADGGDAHKHGIFVKSGARDSKRELLRYRVQASCFQILLKISLKELHYNLN